MSFAEFMAKSDLVFRPILSKFPARLNSAVYSAGRKIFLSEFAKDVPKIPFIPDSSHNLKLWDLNFGNGIFNAAGMFKLGEAYEVVAAQGAGAYLAGTTTSLPRTGNTSLGIKHPFIPYTFSGSASNWMGLPNEGHAVVASRIAKLGHRKNCPIGVSISSAPELTGIEAMEGLLDGFQLYDKAGVCFIELNESCPNVPHEHGNESSTSLDSKLIERLEFVSKAYLNKRQRNLPVIVKFSNDTELHQIPALIDALYSLGFDGINLGNTSIRYEYYRTLMDKRDFKNFDFFTKSFGGGLSGRLLKENSLQLASHASAYLKSKDLSREFHVIRTGGIETKEDLLQSQAAGILLNQWFTGYFDQFAHFGHDVYKHILS
jgi:dihydroorotate dehydrogenase